MLYSFQPRNLRITLSIDSSLPAYLGETFPVVLKFTNHDTVTTHVTLHAILHPISGTASGIGTDSLRVEGVATAEAAGNANISSQILISALGAGQSVERQIYLISRGHPGARLIDLSIICKPDIPSSQNDSATVAPTEIARHIPINVVHPFFCDFKTIYYRTPSRSSEPKQISRDKAKISDTAKPGPWEGAYRCLLDVNLGALGPTKVEVLGIKLNFSVSVTTHLFHRQESLRLMRTQNVQDQIRITRSSLDGDNGQLPSGASARVDTSRDTLLT